MKMVFKGTRRDELTNAFKMNGRRLVAFNFLTFVLEFSPLLVDSMLHFVKGNFGTCGGEQIVVRH
jgi:hypothetical protein